MKAHDYFAMVDIVMNEAYNMFQPLNLKKKIPTILYYKNSWMLLPVK